MLEPGIVHRGSRLLDLNGRPVPSSRGFIVMGTENSSERATTTNACSSFVPTVAPGH